MRVRDHASRSLEGQSVGRVATRLLSSLPGTLTSILPVGLCAACWPAYAGLFASLGVGFLLDTVYLLPLTVLSLLLAVGGLAYHAGTRRGFGPAGAGLVASTLVVLGKFVLQADMIVYTGVGLLIGASLWNAWPRRRVDQNSCASCESATLPE